MLFFLFKYAAEKKIDKDSLINFALVENPKFTATFMDMFLKVINVAITITITWSAFNPNGSLWLNLWVLGTKLKNTVYSMI